MIITDQTRIKVIAPCTGSAPVVGAITGAPVMCMSNSQLMSVAASGGYWSSSSPDVATVNSSGTVTGITAGNTTISYTVTNSCGSTTATKAVTVNIGPTGLSATPAGPTTFCLGNSVSVAASAIVPLPVLSQNLIPE